MTLPTEKYVLMSFANVVLGGLARLELETELNGQHFKNGKGSSRVAQSPVKNMLVPMF